MGQGNLTFYSTLKSFSQFSFHRISSKRAKERDKFTIPLEGMRDDIGASFFLILKMGLSGTFSNIISKGGEKKGLDIFSFCAKRPYLGGFQFVEVHNAKMATLENPFIYPYFGEREYGFRRFPGLKDSPLPEKNPEWN